jgi:hypothetical protein
MSSYQDRSVTPEEFRAASASLRNEGGDVWNAMMRGAWNSLVRERARRTRAEARVAQLEASLTLTPEESAKLEELMANPPSPPEKLVALFREHRSSEAPRELSLAEVNAGAERAAARVAARPEWKKNLGPEPVVDATGAIAEAMRAEAEAKPAGDPSYTLLRGWADRIEAWPAADVALAIELLDRLVERIQDPRTTGARLRDIEEIRAVLRGTHGEV